MQLSVTSLLISLQDHHGSGFAVFWMGIAFWLLFALVPSRYLVSLIHKHAHQVQSLLQLRPGSAYNSPKQQLQLDRITDCRQCWVVVLAR